MASGVCFTGDPWGRMNKQGLLGFNLFKQVFPFVPTNERPEFVQAWCGFCAIISLVKILTNRL